MNRTIEFFDYLLDRSGLLPREIKILKARLRSKTLEQSGRGLKIGMERTRQIEAKATRKLLWVGGGLIRGMSKREKEELIGGDR